MEILRPKLAEAGGKSYGKVVMMLEGAGFKVANLGTEVTAEQFVEAVREHKPDIIGMSGPAYHGAHARHHGNRGFEGGRPAGCGQGDGGRGAGDPGVRPKDRGGRVRPRRGKRRRSGQTPGGKPIRGTFMRRQK